jgi:hypothetical protein
MTIGDVPQQRDDRAVTFRSTGDPHRAPVLKCGSPYRGVDLSASGCQTCPRNDRQERIRASRISSVAGSRAYTSYRDYSIRGRRRIESGDGVEKQFVGVADCRRIDVNQWYGGSVALPQADRRS